MLICAGEHLLRQTGKNILAISCSANRGDNILLLLFYCRYGLSSKDFPLKTLVPYKYICPQAIVSMKRNWCLRREAVNKGRKSYQEDHPLF